MIGTRIAHYEITNHLGSGGMGEVYQATDTKLARSVAIKLLPEEFARDADRAARFEREARVLASLNHPHIAAIHGLEESGDRKFLVMELADGETLAARLMRGPIPIDEALAIARQIAEALEAAHEKGIVHRDLKPANIKVNSDGQVKVLDFGLAKAFAGDASDVRLSNSPTVMSIAASNAGMILGTAAYMSPEQARGATVDRRTDVFAFGAVLYEMITGRQAFPGDTVSDILAAVLKQEPEWDKIPQSVSLPVRRLLSLCLEKDRTRRLQTAADARIRIDEAQSEPAIVNAAAAPRAQSRLGKLRLILEVGLLATLALSIPAAIRSFRDASPAESPELRLEIVTPPQADPLSFAISPDGKQLVFVAPAQLNAPLVLWVRALNSTQAQPLARTDGAQYPFWSPDSRSVGFFADSKLKRIDINGGLPETLANTSSPRGGSWSAEGVILFTPTVGSPLFRVPARGGDIVPVTKLGPSQTSHRFPRFLHGGRRFLFFAQAPAQSQGIYIGSLDSPEIKLLTLSNSAGDYVTPGWLMYVRQGTLIAQRLDLERDELDGDPVTVADAVVWDGNFLLGAFSTSSAGLISYRSGSGANPRQLIWFDRAGKALGALGPVNESFQAPELDPSGSRVAVSGPVQSNTDIWLLDAARSTRFTFDDSFDRMPVWSPTGNEVMFASSRPDSFNLYRKSVSHVGGEELILESSQNKAPLDWSADGRFLLYSSSDETGYDLWFLPLDGDRKPVVFLKTKFNDKHGQFSPDGRWVAYQSNESGRYEIYIAPFPSADAKWPVSTAGGIQPRWAPNGKELYYIAPDAKLMAAPLATNGVTIQPGTPTALFQTRILGGGIDQNNRSQYDVAPDGHFLVNSTPEGASSGSITILLNWHPESAGK